VVYRGSNNDELHKLRLLFPLPSQIPPGAITRGPDGNIWFTESETGTTGARKIGRITPQGVITEFPLSSDGGPVDIAAGPDGNLWFTNYNGMIERMTPGGKITTFRVPNTDSSPSAIIAGPDGNMWFTDESRSGNAPMIGRVVLGK
jgi:virginiamycin B lyase